VETERAGVVDAAEEEDGDDDDEEEDAWSSLFPSPLFCWSISCRRSSSL